MVRNILAVIAGIVVGSLINGSLIAISHHVILPPPGADMKTAEGFAAALPLLQPKHFIFPFLAHAFGTLIGAMVAVAIAKTHKNVMWMIIGVVFLCGGIAAALMIPAPMWFILVDLVFAYTPMAWLGGRIAGASRI